VRASGLVMTLAVIFMVLAWMVERNRRVSVAEAWILFLAGVLFWASGIGTVLWVLVNGIYRTMGGH
jgi:hypothetical protein